MNYIYVMKNGLFKLFLNDVFQGCYFITHWTLQDAKDDNLEIRYSTF
jgi:hypothetical protein